MSRPWIGWAAFVAATLVLVGAMSTVTIVGLQLDRAEQQSRARAAVEERIRLALWRMDSTIAPIIATESARPYFHYVPFYAAERAYTKMFAPQRPGDVLVPSPLLTLQSPYIRIHFQYAPDGSLSSPNFPTSNMRDLAETGYLTHEQIEETGATLGTMRTHVTWNKIARELERAVSVPLSIDDSPANAAMWNEYEQRAKSFKKQVTTNQALTDSQLRTSQPSDVALEDADTPYMTLFWSDDELFLIRALTVDGGQYLQGCWLNWQVLRAELESSIADLLPGATVVPSVGSAAAESNRRLASAPIQLSSIDFDPPLSAVTPLRIALGGAWLCMIAVLGAVGALLWGTYALAERRATFVSAVTHELRTPLTTFQLYTDLLAEDRVPDEGKRRAYLETLRSEATRLRHLVENVLAFARLERSPATAKPEAVSCEALIGRLRAGVDAQCAQADMTLDWGGCSEVDCRMETNVEIVQQIVANLVDNACKYAAEADDKRVCLQVSRNGDTLGIRVRDFGPGLGSEAVRKLFRPFGKSASDAAASAPGVGLGLALSRRLARTLGGDLVWRKDVSPGCCFELTLPVRDA